MRTRPQRIAIYCQDGLGLGHLRRNSLIGGHILKQVPDSSILLFTDSPVAPFFRLAPGMDHVKLPSFMKVRPGEWQAVRLPLAALDMQRLRIGLLERGLLEYEPDLLLVDHMPQGAHGELIGPLRALRHARPQCQIVLGLRDVLDAPELTRRVWRGEGAHEALAQFYDQILVYGCRELFDTAAVYALPMPAGQIQFCGYVVNREVQQTAESVRARVGVQDRKLVLVAAGGGHDGRLLIQTYLESLRVLGDRVDFATLVTLGANAPAQDCSELAQLAQGLPVQIVNSLDDSLSHMGAADLMVCMGGYNTLAEVLFLQKKAIVIPRAGPSAEQRIRARLFAERDLIDMIDPDKLTPALLAERIVLDLARNDFPRPSPQLSMQGSECAAEALVQILGTNVYA